ncbi:30S ribosomal protein S3 [Candidatus Aerophobetes bacterium]|uniref:Small ribosomal subunit protein uS3 n=1 Tax=Aerophobetes bacterium TaxID=2030807 RepID=A0A523YM27_UNCAE|nr:MAG: 30S ribosomal protein S3 [Candidatus Aerophobetes bacterium]
MGQKVNPEGFRLGIVKNWKSRWYEEKEYALRVQEDLKIRNFIKEKFKRANISKIMIERAVNKVRVNIFAARPGIIIGRKGEAIEKTREELERLIIDGKIFLNVEEINQPDLDAQLVAERMAFQLERRIGAKRLMRQAISRTMELGAEGVKITCKGRIAGAEIARTEWMKEGRIPLHTIRADIDYGVATAHTTYGCIGVKVWICKGEVLPALRKEEFESDTAAKES